MSHYVCNRCHGRFRDEHECPADGEALLERVQALEARLAAAEEKIDILESTRPTYGEK